MMKIAKKRKLIISSALVAMITISAVFEITSRKAIKPIYQNGNIEEMENISIASQKTINGQTKFSLFGKNGTSVEYGKIFLNRNLINSNFGLKKYNSLSKKSEYDSYDLNVNGKNYLLFQKSDTKKGSLIINICDEKSNSTITKEIPIKEKDRKLISNINDFMEKDGKFYALAVTDKPRLVVVSLDLEKESYKITDIFNNDEDFTPILLNERWDPSNDYLYVLMKNDNVDEESNKDNYLVRYDFKTDKFLKIAPLDGLEDEYGFVYTDFSFLYEDKKDKFIAYSANIKDKHIYKFTYDLNTLKLLNKEKLNLKLEYFFENETQYNEILAGVSDESQMILKHSKIYYISSVRESYAGNDVSTRNSIEMKNTYKTILKVFDVDKNKVVYESEFDPMDISNPMFIVDK